MWPLVSLSLLLPPQAIAEPVPESARAASDLCGVTGESVAAIRDKLSADPSVERRDADADRFETYYSSIDMKQWTFTKQNDPAHPAGTCVRIFSAGGGAMIERQMRCDASREACDALAREFQTKDESARKGNGPST
jgi:hypothetical protein